MNLEPELAVGHSFCSCSFCKINKVHKQSIRRFVFGRLEYNLLRGLRGIDAEKPPRPKIKIKRISAIKKKLEKEARELPDVAELDKRLESITC